MFKDYESPFALVRTRGECGYGHMTVEVRNAAPGIYRCPTLYISCQIGHGHDWDVTDEMFSRPYAERWGMQGRDGDVVTLDDLAIALPVMKRIQRRLDKLAKDVGYPLTYDELVFRILTALTLQRVCFVETYGGGYHCNTEDLPHVEMNGSWSKDELRRKLKSCLDELQAKFERPKSSHFSKE